MFQFEFKAGEKRSFRALVAAAAVSLAAGSASAAVTQLTFTTPGGAQPQVYFAGYQPGTTVIDSMLHATFDASLASVTGGGYQWNFTYNVANTSTGVSRLSVLGFDIDPGASGVLNVDGVFGSSASGNMASLGDKAFCLKDGGGANCSGGGSGGLNNGSSGSGSFSLVFQSQQTIFTFVQQPIFGKGKDKDKIVGYQQVQVPTVVSVPAPTQVVFKNFGIRLQSLANGGSTVGVAFDRPTPPPGGGGLGGAAIPEPATWALMIGGFALAGGVLRAQRRKVATVLVRG